MNRNDTNLSPKNVSSEIQSPLSHNFFWTLLALMAEEPPKSTFNSQNKNKPNERRKKKPRRKNGKTGKKGKGKNKKRHRKSAG